KALSSSPRSQFVEVKMLSSTSHCISLKQRLLSSYTNISFPLKQRRYPLHKDHISLEAKALSSIQHCIFIKAKALSTRINTAFCQPKALSSILASHFAEAKTLSPVMTLHSPQQRIRAIDGYIPSTLH
ncbi:hypothetical protein HAX54_027770, partial [Datura stramonium]|nr:hypothetical protein [Datura stramonium]